MCLTPIFIPNRSRTILMDGTCPRFIAVPCGHCAECLRAKRTEWNYRTWYEVLSCIDAGGYILFDTLTHRDEDVPRVSDVLDFDVLMQYRKEELELQNITGERKEALLKRYLKRLQSINNMCFNKEDIKLFLKRLRRELAYLGYKKSGCFKYFLTSEYGTSDKGTHRPHYHILFFVYDPTLHPLALSKLINKCWQLGRTDGIDYHTAPYVFNHVYGYRGLQFTTAPTSLNVSGIQAACSYVSKYITKDSRYEKIAENRARGIMSLLFGNDWYQRLSLDGYIDKKCKKFVAADDEIPWDSYETFYEHYSKFDINRIYKSIKRSMEQFHMQSNGFGADFLKYNSYESVKQTGLIARTDPKRGVVLSPLPRYYQYRIFYSLQRDFNNHLYWQLNDEGKEFKRLALDRSFDAMTRKMEDWLSSMHSFDYYCDLPTEQAQQWYLSILKPFEELNGDRPIADFVKYLIYYKGRIKTKAQVEREKRGEYRVEDLSVWKFYFFRDITKDSDVVYNYATPTDEEQLGLKFVSKKYYGDAELWNHGGEVATPYQIMEDMEYHMDFDYFDRKYVINDKSDPSFVHYDEMFELYCKSMFYKNKFLQSAFTNKENLKISFKESFFFQK